MAMGRPQKPYQTSWNDVIPGLYRCPDGRWRINATGQKFTEADERRAVQKFRHWETTHRPDPTVPVPVESKDGNAPAALQAVAGIPSKAPTQLIDLLAENPYCTVKGAAQRLDVAFTTAQRTIDRLAGLSILSPISDAKRGRVYCAAQIMNILDEPAKITAKN